MICGCWLGLWLRWVLNVVVGFYILYCAGLFVVWRLGAMFSAFGWVL